MNCIIKAINFTVKKIRDEGNYCIVLNNNLELFVFNEVAYDIVMFMLNLEDSAIDINEISLLLADKYNADIKEIRLDVENFIMELNKDKILNIIY